MNSGPDIYTHVVRSTAAIVVPGEGGSPAKAFGSGVFVALDNRRFILTAGHCVRDASTSPILIPYSSVPQGAPFEAPCRGYIDSDTLDIGYFELPATVWRTLDAGGKVFMSYRSLHVDRAAAFVDDDYYVVSGCPREHIVERAPQVEMLRPCIVVTSVAGRGARGPSPVPCHPDIEGLDLVVDDRIQAVDLRAPNRQAALLPALEGMSGGPCWKGFSQREPLDWTPDRLRLVGVHIGHNASKNPEEWRVARSILVGHHLRLIARDFLDLADFIFSTWPVLAAWAKP